jgi:signal transduction histidine kinase
MGLGLWLVKWFVDSYDGELAFDENDPRGSVVVVRLPRTEPRDDPEPQPTPAD